MYKQRTYLSSKIYVMLQLQAGQAPIYAPFARDLKLEIDQILDILA